MMKMHQEVFRTPAVSVNTCTYDGCKGTTCALTLRASGFYKTTFPGQKILHINKTGLLGLRILNKTNQKNKIKMKY